MVLAAGAIPSLPLSLVPLPLAELTHDFRPIVVQEPTKSGAAMTFIQFTTVIIHADSFGDSIVN
jgi:hypothetical protein